MRSLKKRLQSVTVPEFARHRLRMLARLGEGAFGTVSVSPGVPRCSRVPPQRPLDDRNPLCLQLYVAEAEGIPDYGGGGGSMGPRLVAVKFLNQGASEKEK